MSNIIKNIKQFVIKHDELFLTLIFFVIIFGPTVCTKTIAEDELWNFQNIYKMYNGYKIYVDANVITTPLFHIIGLFLFKIFGANFFIFRFYGILINTILMLQGYKIFKLLTKSKLSSLFLSILLLIIEMNVLSTIANYNALSLVFVLWGILNKSNGYMDEPLLGNFGKDGEDGVIKQIEEMKDTKILIKQEKQSYQESDKIRQYIKDNLKYIGEIEDFLIYKTMEE